MGCPSVSKVFGPTNIQGSALRIHIRNGILSRWTGFLWSFSSISNQLQVNSQGFQSENQSRGLHQTAASKPKKVGRVKTCQNPDVTVIYCILVGGILEPWNLIRLPIILGSCHDSSIIFQSLPNHVVSSSFIPYEKPMISEVSLRTIRGGIPGFVLVSYKPLYHISLRISNETTICLSLNPHMNIWGKRSIMKLV